MHSISVSTTNMHYLFEALQKIIVQSNFFFYVKEPFIVVAYWPTRRLSFCTEYKVLLKSRDRYAKCRDVEVRHDGVVYRRFLNFIHPLYSWDENEWLWVDQFEARTFEQYLQVEKIRRWKQVDENI